LAGPLGRAAGLALLLALAGGMLNAMSRPPALRVSTIPLRQRPDSIVLDPRTGRAFVGDATAGTVSVLDLAHARLVRTVRVGGACPLAPLALTLDSVTHRILAATCGDANALGVVQMFDSRSGTRLAAVHAGHGVSALAVDSRQGHVFVADDADDTVAMLDALSGAVLHTTPVGVVPLAVSVNERTARLFVVGPSGPARSALGPRAASYSGASGLLSVLDSRSGALLRTTPLGGGPSALAVDERTARVFVANSNDGTVSALDAHNGTLLRTITIGDQPTALAVDERRGRAYVVDADAGTLSLLDATGGTLLRTVRVDPTPSLAYPLPCALAVDEARDRVYLSTWGPLVPAHNELTLRGMGTLYVLDARTGTVLRRIAVGVAPVAVAVEEVSGRIVVVNYGGVVARNTDGWSEQWTRRLRAWLPWLGRLAAPASPSIRVPGSVSMIDGET
jgi:YVTN family beta-propeller protein